MKLTTKQLKRIIKEEMNQMVGAPDQQGVIPPELQGAVSKLYKALPPEALKQLDETMAEGNEPDYSKPPRKGIVHDVITDPGTFYIAMMSSPVAASIAAQLTNNSGVAAAAGAIGVPIAMYIIHMLKEFHDEAFRQ